MYKTNLWPALVLILGVTSCAQQATKPTTSSVKRSKTVRAKKSLPKSSNNGDVTTEESEPAIDEALLRKLSAPNTVVLDVRDSNEFVNGHLKGAINIDFMKADFEKRIAKLDRKKKYLLYCSSGNRSGKALRYFLARKMKAEKIGTFGDLKNRGAEVEGVEESTN